MPPTTRSHWQRRVELVFWIAFAIWATSRIARTVRNNVERDGTVALDVSQDVEVSDYECLVRGAKRMADGLDVYFTDGSRLEMAPKRPPFGVLAFEPFVLLPPVVGEALLAALLFGVLAWTLVLARRAAEHAAERPVPALVPMAALLLLAPFVHLAAAYTQVTPLEVFLFFAGLVAAFRGRAFTGGVLWSVAIAIKVTPVVLVALLVWKRAWRMLAGVAAGLVATTLAVLLACGPPRGLEHFRAFAAMLRDDPAHAAYHERFQGVPTLIRGTVTEHYEPQLASVAQETDWDGVRNFLGGTGLHRHTDLWIGLAVGAILLGCALCCRRRAGDHPRRWLGECGLVAIAMLAVSPHTWKHYFWWLAPALLLALVELREPRRRWAIAFVAAMVLLMTLPHRGTLPKTWAAGYGVFHGFAVGLVVLFAVLAGRLWSRRREPTG